MILQGDCRDVLATLEPESVQTCVTSPPYWGLRDYGVSGQLGLEATPEEYVTALIGVFAEVRRVLRADGTLWLNLGDSYASPQGGTDPRQRSNLGGGKLTQDLARSAGVPASLKPKDLCMIPARVALALQADGWYLRSDIIWSKPNPMPESVTDRPTKAHEYIFLLSKSERYFYDADAIAEPLVKGDAGSEFHTGKTGQHQLGRASQKKRSGNTVRVPGSDRIPGASHVGRGFPWEENGTSTRNARSVWTIPTKPYSEAHFATFPPELARRCILAGSKPGDTVLDPFNGAGTTGLVAQEHNRKYVGIELNPEYVAIAERRLSQNVLPLLDGAA